MELVIRFWGRNGGVAGVKVKLEQVRGEELEGFTEFRAASLSLSLGWFLLVVSWSFGLGIGKQVCKNIR